MTQPARDFDAPSDQTIIQTLLQEVNILNDQRMYLKAQVTELRGRLVEANAQLESATTQLTDTAAAVENGKARSKS